MKIRVALALAVAGAFSSLAGAAAPAGVDISKWNTPVEPFKVYGNTYYVGTQNLTSILITSDFGHVLIDGGLPETAPIIAANIKKLGFNIADVKAILQSHAHPDHVGGIAELQKLSGAAVYARRPADEAMRTGKLPKEDPQYNAKTRIPTVANPWVVHGDQLLGVGSNRLPRARDPGPHPRRHELDVGDLRGEDLPAAGLRGQPVARVGREIPLLRPPGSRPAVPGQLQDARGPQVRRAVHAAPGRHRLLRAREAGRRQGRCAEGRRRLQEVRRQLPREARRAAWRRKSPRPRRNRRAGAAAAR